jgi:hypothetical protein
MREGNALFGMYGVSAVEFARARSARSVRGHQPKSQESWPSISAVISSRLQIMPGRRAFLRRRHVAAGASHANRRPRVRIPVSLLPVAVLACWNSTAAARFRCSGRRRPCAPGRLAIDDLGSCDCRHRYPGGDSTGTSHPPASSLVTLRGQAPSICRRGKSPMSAGSAA